MVQAHPNATVAALTTGPAAFVVWALSNFWPTIPAAAAAGISGAIITGALLAGRSIRCAALAIDREGLIPLLRRLVFGRPAPPPPPPAPDPPPVS